MRWKIVAAPPTSACASSTTAVGDAGSSFCPAAGTPVVPLVANAAVAVLLSLLAAFLIVEALRAVRGPRIAAPTQAPAA